MVVEVTRKRSRPAALAPIRPLGWSVLECREEDLDGERRIAVPERLESAHDRGARDGGSAISWTSHVTPRLGRYITYR
jgi:hypothetical protein